MPTFTYQAINETGSAVRGTVDAETATQAERLLDDQGLMPMAIQSAQESRGSWWHTVQTRLESVKLRELIIFTKQMQTMLKAGIPMVRLLQVLEHQTQNRRLKQVVADVARDIREGKSLHQALSEHSHVFSRLYLSMIQAGETSGSLTEILDRLIYIIEHEHKIKSDIRSALQYPIMVVVALGIAFFVLLTYVIPKFAVIFASAGIDLPLPTRVAVGLYDLLSLYWYLLIVALVILITGLVLFVKTATGRFVRDTFLLNLPIFGSLFQKAAMSRFASIFAILQSSGVPVLETLRVLSETIGNSAISRSFDRVRDRITEGQGISIPLKTARYFPPMVVDMVAIGEETGNLDDMMRDVSVHYDDEVSYAVKGLSDALGPVLIVGLAAVVGFFALAIFMPMWDLTQTIR